MLKKVTLVWESEYRTMDLNLTIDFCTEVVKAEEVEENDGSYFAE